jgi:predicted AlkP superfamily pyrophosphatase or phosphodiesterase
MTKPYAALLSIPGLRPSDVASMPRLAALTASGAALPLAPTYPCLTWPVQASLASGVGPERHGVVANGFYWRAGTESGPNRPEGEVEMWTAWNEVIQAPQIWDRLHDADRSLTSAVWFPLLSKGAGSDYICTFAPIHNPDGTESLWCYTRPTELYGELRDTFGHFPLMHFWGPLANIKSTQWIVDSLIFAATRFQPRFSYVYLPHLDYAAQKFGPDSPQAIAALGELDAEIGRLADGFAAAGMSETLWLAAGEYAITAVDSVVYPNRLLRDAGFLSLVENADGTETLVPAESRAFAMVDHQLAHVFVNDAPDVEAVAKLFRSAAGVERVLVGDERSQVGLNHPRSGEIVLLSDPTAWFAYYWWLDDAKAPPFARTVDIHHKPGYDPVEMFIDMPTKSTPLDATLVKGSHGYPADDATRQTVLLCSDATVLPAATKQLRDVEVAGLVYRNFGVKV